MRRIRVLAISFAALLGLAASAAQAAQLRGVTLVEGETGTHAVLDLTAPADYKVFTLANPHRLVLDLSGSSVASGFRAPSPNGLVSGVRTGKPAEGDLRVVLDLGSAVQPRSRIEREGDSARLIVELNSNDRPSGTPAVARTLEDVIGPGERKLIVAIDAGHGGKDPGAIGPTRKYEKDITLAMARELAAQGQAQFLLPLCVVGPVGHEAACVGQTPEHVGSLFGGMTGQSQPALCMFGRLCVATGSVQQTGQIVQGVRVLRFLGQGLLKIGHGGLITAHAREHRTQGVQDVGVVGAQLPRLLKHRQRLLAVEMAIGVQLDAQRKERLGLNAFGHGRLKGWAHAGMDCPVMMRWWRGRQTLW